jgi:hypothetical protein
MTHIDTIIPVLCSIWIDDPNIDTNSLALAVSLNSIFRSQLTNEDIQGVMYATYYDEFPFVVKFYEIKSKSTFYTIMDANILRLQRLFTAITSADDVILPRYMDMILHEHKTEDSIKKARIFLECMLTEMGQWEEHEHEQWQGQGQGPDIAHINLKKTWLKDILRSI